MPSDDEGFGDTDLFREPEGYYQPTPPATYVEYQLKSGELLKLRLVGQNPLWGHMLWNAGKIAASYLEENATDLVHGKTVLELGAGAGLPSLVCALKGARKVVATDYPDQELIRNLEENVSSAHVPDQSCVTTQGFLWGNEPKHLIEELPEPDKAFDLLILADLIFNHSEHRKLISTIQSTLRKGSNAQALVFFTPHRPWLLHKDLAFFDLAKEEGLIVEKIVEEKVMKAMFDKDYGDEELRRTVFGYRLRWT